MSENVLLCKVLDLLVDMIIYMSKIGDNFEPSYSATSI